MRGCLMVQLRTHFNVSQRREARSLPCGPANRRPLEGEMDAWTNLMNVMALTLLGGVALVAIVAFADGVLRWWVERQD